MHPMHPARLLLLLSLLVVALLLVATGRLLPALPAGEGIYVSAAVTVLLGGLMIGSYAHFLNLTRWESRRLSLATRGARPAAVALALALIGGLALLWPMLRSSEPVVGADAGQYLHFDVSDPGAEAVADDGPSSIHVKFTSGRE